VRLKLCSVAYTCSCAAQKVGLHRAATRSIGTHASSVMRAGWKCAWGVPSRGRADVGYKKPDKPPPADPGLKNAGHGREADEPLRKRRLLRPPKLAGQRRKECFRATADCPLLARNTQRNLFRDVCDGPGGFDPSNQTETRKIRLCQTKRGVPQWFFHHLAPN